MWTSFSVLKTIKARDEMTADKSIRNLFLYIEELYKMWAVGTGQSSLNVISLLQV